MRNWPTANALMVRAGYAVTERPTGRRLSGKKVSGPPSCFDSSHRILDQSGTTGFGLSAGIVMIVQRLRCRCPFRPIRIGNGVA